MARGIRVVVGVAALAIGLSAGAASALGAASVSYSNATGLSVTDPGNSANQLSYSETPQAGGGLQIQIAELSFGTGLQAGGSCSPTGTSTAVCTMPAGGSRALTADLGAGDDVMSWQLGDFWSGPLKVSGGDGKDRIDIRQGAATSGPAFPAATLDGGPGDDTVSFSTLRFTPGGASMLGGDGNDKLTGGPGADTLDGGAGNDTLQDGPTGGGADSDTLRGGTGNDTLVPANGRGTTAVTDTFDGGADVDTLDLSLENSAEVSGEKGHAEVSLDGVANDRWVRDAGGFDLPDRTYSVAGIENLKGTPDIGFAGSPNGDDVLIGSSGANVIDGGSGSDVIRGGGSVITKSIFLPSLKALAFSQVSTTDTLLGGIGDDTITGSNGTDQIDGGLGVDTISGLAGNDSIVSKDFSSAGSAAADSVNCGSGTDAVAADLLDTITACENVDVSPLHEGRHVVLLSTRPVGRDRVLAVALRCPVQAGIACRGRLSLRIGRARAGSSAKYTIRRGRRGVVRVTLTAAGIRRLHRHAGVRALLTSVEAGRIGPKTTSRVVTLRRR